MNGTDIKQAMEQIHISEEMQEQILINVQKQLESRKAKTRKAEIRSAEARKAKTRNAETRNAETGKAETRNNGIRSAETRKDEIRKVQIKSWKKVVAATATIVLAAAIVGIPVQALVENLVKARMESIPEETVQNVAEFIREQNVEADSFSREYSAQEKERMKELRMSYQNGTFPEKAIFQVDHIEEAIEGMLCYVNDMGLFCLPDREMTDEEILEIIDFNRIRAYAIEQSPAAQEARREYQETQDRFKEQVQVAGGISEEEALEIARKQMEDDLGALAEGKDDITIYLMDISHVDYGQKGDIAYFVVFMDPKELSKYVCWVDSIDGSILKIQDDRR